MDKSFAISHLRASGYSERRIARTLGVSRGAVRRHLRASEPNSTTAPTGSTEQAPTGSGGETGGAEAAPVAVSSCSQCESFRELIIAKCELGLSAKRIHQDLVADHGFEGKCWGQPDSKPPISTAPLGITPIRLHSISR